MVELGHSALIASFLISCVQGGLPFFSKHLRVLNPLGSLQLCAGFQFLLVLFSFLSLIYAYVTSDFNYLNVAENSHQDTPLLYKITGVWGNHEGSMLLWLFLLTFYTACVAFFQKNSLKFTVLGLQGWVSIGIHAFILLTSNPFWSAEMENRIGQGLNPLLEDPALAFHPPLLYLGYVGASLGFSYGIAGLWKHSINQAWLNQTRLWILLSWSFLTLGIALGSWWAYYELGWGGWWFWDPVENASLLPWLSGTALIHCLRVFHHKGALKRWTVLLSLLTFIFSLLGTFLVRSGILSSIHSFATDPQRGLFILAFLAIITIGSLGVYAFRARCVEEGPKIMGLSRDSLISLQNIFFVTLLSTVCLGLLYPLVLDSIFHQSLFVGPPYFHLTFVPLGLVVVFLMAISPYLPWKAISWRKLFAKAQFFLTISLFGALIILYGVQKPPILALLSFSVSCGALYTSLTPCFQKDFFKRFTSVHKMSLAHLGVAVMVFGMSADVLWRKETLISLKKGQAVEFGEYTLKFKDLAIQREGTYLSERADLQIFKDGRELTVLKPERRFYFSHQTLTTETALYTHHFSDLYVALGTNLSDNRRIFRLYYHPLVNWIWGGAVLMALAGFLSAFWGLKRKYKG